METKLKFNQLFDQLQVEVTKLLKQKETLEQNVATKLARQTYLQDAITELETKRTESEQSTADTLAVNAERLADDKQKLQQLQEEYDDIRAQIVSGEQKVSTMQQVADAEMKRLDAVVQAKIQEKDRLTAIVDKDITAKQQELQLVTTELKDSQKAATILDGQVSHKTQEVSSEIAKLDADIEIVRRRHQDVVAQLDTKQDELEMLTSKLTALQADIEGVATARAEFEQYKDRATKVLEAREGAILDREATLQQQDRRKQSPPISILDNL